MCDGAAPTVTVDEGREQRSYAPACHVSAAHLVQRGGERAAIGGPSGAPAGWTEPALRRPRGPAGVPTGHGAGEAHSQQKGGNVKLEGRSMRALPRASALAGAGGPHECLDRRRRHGGLMPTPLHVLILEDSPVDVELMLHELQRAGFEPLWQHVATEQD